MPVCERGKLEHGVITEDCSLYRYCCCTSTLAAVRKSSGEDVHCMLREHSADFCPSGNVEYSLRCATVLCVGAAKH